MAILQDTVDHIEAHLLEPLYLDTIAERVNVSKYHLLRIWKSATGTGIMEYVRRRRIALSLGDLLGRHVNIDTLADRYGFGCERTYNRVFHEEFGTTPAKWRRNPVPLQILDRFNIEFLQKAGEGLIFLRSIAVLPGFSIAGPEHQVGMAENKAFQTANRLGNAFFHERRKEIIQPVARDIYIGFTTVPDPPGDFTWYQPSLLVDRNSIVPDGMRERHVAPHKYGVFAYMGQHRPEEISSANLSGLWRFVFETWMPTVTFDLGETFHFERIDYARCNRSYCECELYFPISVLKPSE